MMGDNDEEASQLVEQLLDTPDLASALESDRFKQFLDHMPIGIAVSELGQRERITYVNLAFEGLTGRVRRSRGEALERVRRQRDRCG